MEVRQIESKITEAREAYHNGHPIMDDADYDALENLLRQVDPSNPMLQQVGAGAASGPWTKVKHGCPMGSLSKTQNHAETRDWLANTTAKSYCVMEKMDGSSLAMRFENGRFVQAITRGDGETGEDITRNVSRMKFPKEIKSPYTGWVRGEVMLTKQDFAAHFAGYKNPRNAANGVMKSHDGVGCEHLTVFVYEFDASSGNKSDSLFLASILGFQTPQHSVCKKVAEIESLYDDYCNQKRENLPYEIDGLVIEVNDRDARDQYGVVDNRPKGAVAFKFPHMVVPTTINNVLWQVGQSGRVTPVAIFDSVHLVGADVTQASLHNVGYIKRLGGLRKGDRIMVSRRNDVIPAVESVLASYDGGYFEHPDECPECNTKLDFEGEYLVCRGEECPAQVMGGIRRWVDKIGVLHVGEGLIETLVDSCVVSDIADLYNLTAPQMANATYPDGRMVGMTIAQKAIENLSQRMTLDLHIFIGALGIPLFGRSMVKVLVDAGFNTLDRLRGMTLADMARIDGIGPTKGKAFIDGIKAREGLINRLLDAGIKVKAPNTTGAMVGKSMCMTGFRDAAMQAAFEGAGGTIKSSVGKGLTYLVAKDAGSGSSKLQKAQSLGVVVLTPDEMRAMLN
jgi:DNA ligase (NAD+)